MSCGGTQFTLSIDNDEGFAARRCTSCGGSFLMLDSEAADADPGEAACPCGSEIFEIAVDFALGDDGGHNGDVRWVYLGLRCVKDDVLGVYADWEIDYSPTAHLLAQV